MLVVAVRGSVPSSLIFRLTILPLACTSSPSTSSSSSPPTPNPSSLPSLLWSVHLQPLSLGNKAEGFVYWRLEEKRGKSLSMRNTKATGSNCGLIWCCAIFQSDGLDVMQFDIEGVILSRFAPRFTPLLGSCHRIALI